MRLTHEPPNLSLSLARILHHLRRSTIIAKRQPFKQLSPAAFIQLPQPQQPHDPPRVIHVRVGEQPDLDFRAVDVREQGF